MMPDSAEHQTVLRPLDVATSTVAKSLPPMQEKHMAMSDSVNVTKCMQSLSPSLPNNSLASSSSAGVTSLSSYSFHNSSAVMSSSSSHEYSDEISTSRHMSKLKRFLITLQNFADGLSIDIGNQVKNLINSLVIKSISVDEFNHKVTEVTNFPLRPYILPFLKSTLPHFQRQILHTAHLLKMTPQQYLLQNEIFSANVHVPNGTDLQIGHTADSIDVFCSDVNENGKRKSDRKKEDNGHDVLIDGQPPLKRHQPLLSPTIPSNIFSPAANSSLLPSLVNAQIFRFDECPRDLRRENRNDRETRKSSTTSMRDGLEDPDEDEWRNIHTMLNCILGMVDKTKRALAILQQRNNYLNSPPSDLDKKNGYSWPHLVRTQGNNISPVHKDSSNVGVDSKRYSLSPDNAAYDIKRRTEEAVKDFKIQAVVELQRAVTAAESKANKIVATERMKMDQQLEEARRLAVESALTSVNKQEDSTENCWNCGRRASETCSGCNMARYCGAFCQHKDWETHHKGCGKNSAERNTSNPSSPSVETVDVPSNKLDKSDEND